MSVRIRLMMGYGLTNLQCEDGVIIDPRINPNGWLLSDENKQEHWSFDEFDTHIRDEIDRTRTFGQDFNKLDKVNYLTYCNKRLNIHDCIIYDNEMGLDNVLLLIPPTMQHKWYRHDDDLDYYLAANGICSTQTSWYKVSPTNFYPYGGFIDSKNGSRVVNPHSDMIGDLYRENESRALVGSIWTEDLKCKSIDDVKKRYKHALPSTLISLIDYTKLFTNSNVIYDLEPMLYGYWG